MINTRPPFFIPLVLLLSLTLLSCSDKKKDERILSKSEFIKNIIHAEFISEGVAAGDVNKDGLKDILSGAYWFESPNWVKHEIRTPIAYDYAKEWSDSFLNFSMDVNKDGWIDLIEIGFPGKPAYWYENSKGKDGHWAKHLVDSSACNESPMLVDIEGKGQLDLVFGNQQSGHMNRFVAPVGNIDAGWIKQPISKADSLSTHRFSHGLGLGDINGDGRGDVLIKDGWWEAPQNRNDTPWDFHKVSFGEDCSQMYAYDLDDDGDNDVISSSAHKYGIWWHEQVLGQNDSIKFVRHLIDSTFSQNHGLAFHDMNDDGLPDLITGKRFYGHLGNDPGGKDPQVIYWYEMQRDDNKKPYWIPHEIDTNSGIGLQVIIEDMNNDLKPDILIGNKKGVFYFENSL